MSENEGCTLAKQRAKLKALEKVSGQRISSDEIEMCSDIDGKTSCERNQFFLSSFDSEITNLQELKKDISVQKIEGADEQSYICTIKIQAEVIKITKTFLNEEDCERNYESSDRKNLEDGNISISPIKIDMHSYSEYQAVEDWSKISL